MKSQQQHDNDADALASSSLSRVGRGDPEPPPPSDATFADALSSSLASLVAGRVEMGGLNSSSGQPSEGAPFLPTQSQLPSTIYHHRSNKSDAGRSGGNVNSSSSSSNNNSSEEGDAPGPQPSTSSSSSSASSRGEGKGEPRGSSGGEGSGSGQSSSAAMVTAGSSSSNTGGSSGRDDRDSSTGDNASGSGSGGDGSGSGSARRGGTFKDHSSSSDSGPHSDPTPNAHHNNGGGGATLSHHHHHHHRRSTEAGMVAPADGCGLPVPRDDSGPVHQQHASVVAHNVPPPPVHSHTAGGTSGADSSSSDHRNHHNNAASTTIAGSLLPPHKEPGFHTIRRTFNRVRRSNAAGSSAAAASAGHPSRSETDSSIERHHHHHHKYKGGAASKRGNSGKASELILLDAKEPSSKKRKLTAAAVAPSLDRVGSDYDDEYDDAGGNGSSSGSGTEGGYAASASSNDRGPAGDGGAGSCSPSVSSSDGSAGDRHRHKRGRPLLLNHPPTTTSTSHQTVRPLLRRREDSSLSVSSEIADFSSGSSSEGGDRQSFAAAFAPSPSPSRRSSPSLSSSDEEPDPEDNVATNRKAPIPGSRPPRQLQVKAQCCKPPILTVGCDVMAHVLTFLEPPDILDVLTVPLCKDWLNNFTRQPELWRVLCLLEPFKAQVEPEEEGRASSSCSSSGNIKNSSSDDDSSYPADVEVELRRTFGRSRLLYTSFVRCLRYLSRIKEDAVSGRRAPSVVDYGARHLSGRTADLGANQNLHRFLHRARGVVIRHRAAASANNHHNASAAASDHSDISDEDDNAAHHPAAAQAHPEAAAIGVSDDGSSTSVPTPPPPPSTAPHHLKKRRDTDDEGAKKPAAASSATAPSTQGKKAKKRVKYGHSILTQRLLGPAADGTPGQQNELPWSCAIYSIVNWMVAFSDVEGIQTMCLKVLPFILEDEQQRMTAQRAGLTDIVLRGMVMFPDSIALHTAAFHTIVLLARPLGGQEGMLFHSSMVNSSGIFSAENGSADGRNGIAVMLDSMRRFQHQEVLQAMSCWSLVNIALAPSQKEMLVRLGGIEVTANAMTTHPFSAEVQFRALFALINLVIPSVSDPAVNNNEGGEGGGANDINVRDGGAAGAGAVPVEDSSEREMLEDTVDQLVGLVVAAMKTFCASEAILNRACLVLHNLSLTQEFHEPLVLTPNCYQMLEWCLANYPTDQVLQQSAAGTLHRLQITLSSDETLRNRFANALQSQQRESLERAHREALALQGGEQQQQQEVLLE